MQLWREGQATDTTYRIHPMAMLTTPDPAIVSAVSLCRVIAIIKRFTSFVIKNHLNKSR